MRILAQLMTEITGTSRYKPEFEWSNLWIFNLFRMYELVFWRKWGIRAETSWDTRGNPKCHSWESFFVHKEVEIRKFFRQLSFVRIQILYLQPVGISLRVPYSFAIAFDSSLSNQTSNNASYTVTGSNPGLVIYNVGDTGSPGDPTCTYNSVSMTLVNKIQLPSDRFTYMFYLGACSTGSNTVTLGSITFIQYMGMSYSGIQASSTKDSSSTLSSTNTSWSQSTTVVASNCWLMLGIYGQTTITALGGEVVRQDASSGGSYAEADSNATVGTGSQAFTLTLTVNQTKVGILASFAPSGGATTTPMLAMLGAGV